MHRRHFVASVLASLLPLDPRRANALVFCCRAENDLYHGLVAAGKRFPRFATPAEAIAHAAAGAGVLLLADGYPDTAVALSDELRQQARQRQLRLYIEYPAWLMPTTGIPRQARWERGVVTSEFFGPSLVKLRLLGLHECYFLIAPALSTDQQAHLVFAKVAGDDTAVYGLANTETFPLLTEDPTAGTLTATTKLSHFITGRYGPAQDWTTLWATILGWLTQGAMLPGVQFEPSVRPTFTATEHLPAHAERECFERAVDWYSRAKMLIHPSWADQQILLATKYGARSDDFCGPLPADWPAGDGSAGVLEGHGSRILPDGSQFVRWWLRGDCTGETAMVHAFGHAVTHRERDRQIATNLVNSLLTHSPMTSGPRADPSNGAYGLIGWNNMSKYPQYPGYSGPDTYYGDDNARCLLGLVTTARLLDEHQWDERIWLGVLANFRLMGKNGLISERLDGPLDANAWRAYYNGEPTFIEPSYQANTWTLFLWAYGVTEYRPFLDRSKQGIRLTMDAFPNSWTVSWCMTGEMARLVLTLAWLVRVDDTPETRGWLERIAGELLVRQQPSGAIQEWIFGSGGPQQAGSNEAYGTSEGSMIEQNGDPITDLLNTLNFTGLALHEAAAATGDASYRVGGDKITAFLVRAQIHSERHPELHGSWFRAFDYRRWDYWGSNTDWGWGAWCTETGWIQSWNSVILGLRQLNRSLWDLTTTVKGGPLFERLRQQMVPD